MSKIFHPRHSRTSGSSSNNRISQIDANRNLEVILENSDINLEPEMGEERVDRVYKALRLLPEFDGNPNVLTRFIQLCDQLVAQFISAEAGYELSNLALLNGILNKVTGHAARTINSNGIPDTWQGIKTALVNNFSDQRDETALYNDLALLTQRNLTPQEFYEKCQSLFSTIMTYVTLHESVATTIEAKRTLYKKLTLQAYIRGLKEPLGSRIRCMRPETIEKALEYVHEEVNTLYLQQRNDQLPERRAMQSTSSFDPALHSVKPFNLPVPRPFTFAPQLNQPGPSKPFYQPPRPMQAWRPQVPFNHGPSRTQQMFSAPPPNYRAQSNVFRMPQPRPGFTPHNNGPKPMSGVSHFVPRILPRTIQGHDWTKHGNPPPSNYFKTREMNINETDCYDYYEYPDYTYDNYYEQTYTEPYTYEPVYEPSGYSDYVPAYVEEHQEVPEVASDSQDFQTAQKSDKPK